jgi:hypothetical protein
MDGGSTAMVNAYIFLRLRVSKTKPNKCQRKQECNIYAVKNGTD